MSENANVKLCDAIFTEDYLIKTLKKMWIGQTKYHDGYTLFFPFTLTRFGVRCDRCGKPRLDFIQFPKNKTQLDSMNENLFLVKHTKDAVASINGYCKNCMTRGDYCESGIIALSRRNKEWKDFYQWCYDVKNYFEKLSNLSITNHSNGKGKKN